MSLITRGFGENSAPIVHGFGPPPETTAVTVVSGSQDRLFFPGRRRKLYDHLAENLYVRKYSIIASLKSINGKRVDYINESKIECKIDEREVFNVSGGEIIEVKKTKQQNNIFINILSFFKR